MNDKYYSTHNGMSVPNGDTESSILNKLENGVSDTFLLIEKDGFAERLIYLGKEKSKHKFKRIFNGDIVLYNISDIHLLKKSNILRS